jgi:diguanylate cyclase (GGDEF)-like protein/PAS domain S-box-containing protein
MCIRDSAALAAISGGCMAILVYGGYWLSPLIPLIATSLAYSLRRLLDLRLVRARLQEIELRNQLMLDAIGDAVIAVDRAERVVFLNPAAAELLGTSRERALGTPFATLAPLTDLRQGDEVGVARGRRIAELRRPDGTRRDVGVQTRPLRIGGVRGRLHVLTDVTEQRRMTRELAYLATHDPLTGLVNRALLNDRLCQAIARAGRSSLSLAVLLIDLDRFKNVNDGLGHAAGDQLLVALTERLRALLRSVDTVARIGGDEFAVLLQDLARPGDAVTVAEKILSCLTEPFQLAGYEVNVSASIGISIYPGDGASPDELLRNADAAMYGAKRKGRNCCNLFSSEMYAEALGRLELEGQLRTALQRAEFVLHYQPTIDLASNRVTGVEALIRWDSPQRGRVSPATFIPLAEETGLILPIGEWVLSHACRQCLDWQTRGLPQMHIGVNISARQFFHGDLLGLVTRVLEETGLAADRLMLEITETMLMEDVDGAGQTLRALKTRGVQLALDDFGTGYSSLNYLKRLPLDFLKVDRSFVANIGHKQEDEAIVRAVVALATSLGLRVIAEGVEEQDQLSFLREVDCHAAQGFLFSRPLPASELAPRLAA